MLTKSSLSASDQRLIEVLQRTNYGQIEMDIRDGAPVFDEMVRVTRDVKLGAPDCGVRPELDATDFVLKKEHLELFENLRRLGHGSVRIEIKAGLPFRLTFEQPI